MGGKQYQKFSSEPVYPTTFTFTLAAAANIAVNTGAFPAVGDKQVLSAAQCTKILEPDGSGVTAGQIALDDANDKIMVEPGVYLVEYEGRFGDNGTNSDFSFAITDDTPTADVSIANVNGAVLSTTVVVPLVRSVVIRATSRRAIELHLAATTAGGQVAQAAGSILRITRLGNVE